MKYKHLCVLVLFVLNTVLCVAQLPSWEWALNAGDFTIGSGTGIAIGEKGNVYATGYFPGTYVIFGNDTLINLSTNGRNDLYIVKYDSLGNVIWHRRAGAEGNDASTSIAGDTNGNIYVAGTFNSQSIAFDNDTLTNKGGFDSFITKYDSTGQVIWSVSIGGLRDDEILSITIDRTGSGNIYVTGWFESDTLRIGNFILHNPNVNHEDLFIAKYDSSGNVIWAERFGGPSVEIGQGIATSINGNVYVTGYFVGSGLAIGSSVLNSNGYADLLTMMCDSSGNVIWAKSAGGIYYDQGNSLTCDNTNNVYVSSFFESPKIIFGTDTLNGFGSRDLVIVKYDSAGNVIWDKRFGGTNEETGFSITSDDKGNVYLGGVTESSSVDFDNFNITTNGLYGDIFVARFDSQGNVLWAISAGGVSMDISFGIAAYNSGRENIYSTGYIVGYPVHFGNIDLHALTWNGGIYTAKIGVDLINAVETPETGAKTFFYPNPFNTSGNFYFVSPSGTHQPTLILSDMSGRQVSEYVINKNPLEVERKNLAGGVYIYKVIEAGAVFAHGKIVIQ